MKTLYQKTILFPFLLFSCFSGWAGGEQLELRINSKDGIYAKGDTVKISACITGTPTDPYLLQVLTYGQVTQKKEIQLGEGEQLIYAQVFPEKTSVMLKLGPASTPKKNEMVGFLVAPEEFRPGFRVPADLRQYWDGELARLRAQKPKVQISPAVGVSEADAALYKCYKIEINMPEGRPCRGYVAYPKKAKKGTLPIYVHFHAAGVNRPHVPARAKEVLDMAKKGCIALDINAHGILDDQDEAYYRELDRGELKQYERRDFTGVEDYYFHNMYLRDVRALDYAVTLPLWDGKRILLQGGSQGGGQSLAVAGIFGKVSHVCVIYPAITDTGASLDGRRPGWPASVNSRYAGTELGQGMMAYHDAAILASLFTGALHIEVGNIDTVQDPAAVTAAYNNAVNCSEKELFFYPWCGHSGPVAAKKGEWEEAVLRFRNQFIQEALK